MIDRFAVAAQRRARATVMQRLRESLVKVERELRAWDEYDADPSRNKPLLRRDVLAATREMLLDELRKDGSKVV